ncbi:MAG TPA: undecaprenyl-phosphate glucose phosphotransferase [Salinimicrobium sp.]|nr:undecaprenyl-phosphate glucose phosphotransferase [Salinimicrobium sp.]
MIVKKGRYSGYIRPITYLIDFGIINLLALEFGLQLIEYLNFVIYATLGWIILSAKTNFYEIYRFTKVIKIIGLSIQQSFMFLLIIFSFFGIFNELARPATSVLEYVVHVFILVLIFKLSIYYLLKKYRSELGGNFRRTVIIGKNSKTLQLKSFFEKNPEYGYKLHKLIDLKKQEIEIEDTFEYIIKNQIDEIYCSIAELSNKQINALINFADNNLKVLKFLPDNKEIYTKKLDYNYYDYLPILSLRTIPIEDPINQLIKRTFDIVIALFVIVFILSWLTPILAILIKLESKGPVFFKQRRNGLDYKEFYCYKFRSMKPNPEADLFQVRKNDKRITGIGSILRKTSLDELPQFINVLKGDMSVVGPRPHMVSHTHMYAEKVDKFMVRHFVKPGITGLAQVSGFRGEVETERDIIGRVKFDIFYIENWSLLLDVKVLLLTIYNTLKGDKKAY